MRIFKTDLDKEYFSDEGCHIIEILNAQTHPDLSIAQARVASGKETELHALLDTSEIYYILTGNGIATIGQETRKVGKGDCIFIDSNQPQKIKNIGSEDLLFLCICQPRFEEKNYCRLS